MSLAELKSLKRIDCGGTNLYAINILIYYKKNMLHSLNFEDFKDFEDFKIFKTIWYYVLG